MIGGSMPDETLTATEAVRRFSEIINLVRYQGKSFEIVRGKESVARIVPSRPPRSVKVSELPRLFEELPKLDAEALESFANVLREVREAGGSPEDRWD
jgi:antitoxin (DNA-binding transcriptional repressor) of toxin-antitoxin stability system